MALIFKNDQTTLCILTFCQICIVFDTLGNEHIVLMGEYISVGHLSNTCCHNRCMVSFYRMPYERVIILIVSFLDTFAIGSLYH